MKIVIFSLVLISFWAPQLFAKGGHVLIGFQTIGPSSDRVYKIVAQSLEDKDFTVSRLPTIKGKVNADRILKWAQKNHGDFVLIGEVATRQKWRFSFQIYEGQKGTLVTQSEIQSRPKKFFTTVERKFWSKAQKIQKYSKLPKEGQDNTPSSSKPLPSRSDASDGLSKPSPDKPGSFETQGADKPSDKPGSFETQGAVQPHEMVEGEGIPVFDFCTLAPEPNATFYQKQRVIFFDIYGLDKVEAGEKIVDEKDNVLDKANVLKKLHGSQHFREVWTMTFPMHRFYNIFSPIPAPQKLLSQSELSMADLKSAWGSIPEAQFLTYSAACADYIAIPELSHFSAKWTKKVTLKTVTQDGKKKEVQIVTWSFNIIPSVRLSIFKRDGDRFKRYQTLSVKGGGLFDLATDIGAASMEVAKPGNEAAAAFFQKYENQLKAKLKPITSKIDQVKKHIETLKKLMAQTGLNASTLERYQRELNHYMAILEDLQKQYDTLKEILKDPMQASNNIAGQQHSGWAGLVSGLPNPKNCFIETPQPGKKGVLCKNAPFAFEARKVGVAGMSERGNHYCQKLDPQKMESLALCELRARAENIALLVQKKAKKVKGWKLYAQLLYTVDEDGEHDGISLGEQEGVRRGYVFCAKSGKHETGFGRITSVGPGGKMGMALPSTLALRGGYWHTGDRMEEHPQIGVSLTPEFAFLTGFSKNNVDFLKDLDNLYGVSINVGYDMTPYLGGAWGEVWTRTQLEYVFGDTQSDAGFQSLGGQVHQVNFSMLNVFAGPEVKFYVIPRLDYFVGVAGGISVLYLSTPDLKVEGGDEDDSASGQTKSMLIGTGFDILWDPDWQIRFTANYRMNFSEIELKPEAEEGSVFEQSSKMGDFSGFGFKAGVRYIF